jgi:ABC-2 type transport system permease protein
MNIFFTLLRRELSVFFFSLTGYVIIASVTFLIGLSFVMLINNLGTEPTSLPVTALFFNGSLFWFILILVTPVITMRLFAWEKASGTFENLMTTSVGDAQVVAAKFIAALIFYMVMWLPTLGCLFIIRHFADQAAALDPGTLIGTFSGIFLSGCLFLSMGCFASSLTKSQAVAAIVSLAAGVMLFIVGYLAQVVTGTDTWQSKLLSCFNLFKQMEDFTRGVIDTRPLLFYSSLTMLFVFLTIRAVESRRWK